MRRRVFIAGLVAAASWPRIALAQQQSLPVVGFLRSGSSGPNAHLLAAFLLVVARERSGQSRIESSKDGHIRTPPTGINGYYPNGLPSLMVQLSPDTVGALSDENVLPFGTRTW